MRPQLNKQISLEDFNTHYWLRSELIEFCKKEKLPSTGGKITIVKIINFYLQTGQVLQPEIKKAKTINSKFDWHSEPLSLDTIITDSYKNTQNVRRFFLKEIGNHFSFNITFMSWFKENAGKTLRDAIPAWRNIHEQKNGKNAKLKIAPQFEFNTYVHDFLADNPDKVLKDAIICWKEKRQLKEAKIYKRADLRFL